jgi:murein DD-endopeptidase MepM/ murein hydrolase activator NlpD
MSNPQPSTTSLTHLAPPWTQAAAASPSASAPLSTSGIDFQQLLTTIMVGMTLQSLSSSDSTASSNMTDLGMANSAGLGLGSNPLGTNASSGLDFNSLLAPLMLGLLEKLLAQQVQTQDAAPATIAASAPPQVEAAQPEAASAQNEPRGLPVKGVLTQGSRPGHVALDFGVSVGTPVKSTLDGKVVYAGWNNEGYGNLVIVENGPYRVYYAHLSKIPVSVGDKIKANEVIGLSGNTGNSTGPHLHYEVRRSGQQINPTSFTLK